MKITSAVLSLFLLLAPTAAFADTFYDNSSAVNALDTGFPIGGDPAFTGDPQTQGLSFYAPSTSDTYLNSFSLYLNGGLTSGQVEGFIGTWDLTNGYVDSIVYQSAPVPLTGNAQTFTFDPSALDLIPGGSYVAFLSVSFSTSNYNSLDITQQASMPVVDLGTGDTIPGGQIQYIYDSGNSTLWTSQQWDSVTLGTAGGYDAQFSADFASSPASLPPTVTPEPGSLMLLGTGMAGLFAAARRKLARNSTAA